MRQWICLLQKPKLAAETGLNSAKSAMLAALVNFMFKVVVAVLLCYCKWNCSLEGG